MQTLTSEITLCISKCPQIPSIRSNNSFFQNPCSVTVSAVPSNRKKKKKLTLECRSSAQFEKQDGFNRETFTSQALGTLPPKVFVGHSIYKGKAALTVEPRSPEFIPVDSGAFKLTKQGYVTLQFAPAVGVRQYDWSRKQIFSLSVAEVGTMMSLGARDSCEFFHDPNKGKSEEGQVRKILKVDPLQDGSGHMFNLSVQNKIMKVDESIYIPITKGEFAVLVSAFNYLVPYLIGWHTFVNSINTNTSRVYDANPRADLEWSK